MSHTFVALQILFFSTSKKSHFYGLLDLLYGLLGCKASLSISAIRPSSSTCNNECINPLSVTCQVLCLSKLHTYIRTSSLVDLAVA